MDCDDIRETLSARLDGEAGPAAAERFADEHLEDCGGCARWLDRAAAVTRRVRVSAAVAGPDVTAAVLALVPPAPARGPARLRSALGVIGAAQCAAGLVVLAAPASSALIAHSPTAFVTGAWRCAVGVALVVAAVRRTPPSTLIPLLCTVVALLAVRHLAGDPVHGWSSAAHALDVVAHVLDAVALALVLALRRTHAAR
ncbi:zf-HC2 domain-containing protein [Saccharothrix mutabilis subsp. capreolus]|uniref:zf-HC2 domain-containing protein n=3 Tax=Saccharothrix TaxID=2071 RepID=UPI0035E47490|nr:hypothetical protein GCM10017745_81690 [Saccharothrix mutabilis subsp. capreolus]